MTRDERREFLLGRKGIGASEAAQVLGLSKYRTPADAYDRIVSRIDGDVEWMLDEEMTGPMRRGVALEDDVADEYILHSGKRVRHTPQAPHPDHPEIFANPDYEVFADDDEGTGLMEAKTAMSHVFSRIKAFGIPDDYNIQGQVQLACRPRVEWLDYAFVWPDLWEYLCVRVERDDAFIESVIGGLMDFHRDHIEPRIRPTDDYEAFEVPPSSGNVEVITDGTLHNMAEILAGAYGDWKAAEKFYKDEIMPVYQKAMDEQGLDAIEVAGIVRVIYRWKKGGKRLDTSALNAFLRPYGKTVDDFKNPSKPSRPFLVQPKAPKETS